MNEHKTELITQMVMKIDEGRTYLKIQLILTLVWLFEILYICFGYAKINIYYWIILIVCLIGYYHMGKKQKLAMKEYNKLKDEYYERFEDENI